MAILTGNVIEKWSENLVPNATVSFVVPGQLEAIAVRETELDGYFAVELDAGWYDIIVTAPNYEEIKIKINLFADMHQNIVITPKFQAL